MNKLKQIASALSRHKGRVLLVLLAVCASIAAIGGILAYFTDLADVSSDYKFKPMKTATIEYIYADGEKSDLSQYEGENLRGETASASITVTAYSETEADGTWYIDDAAGQTEKAYDSEPQYTHGAVFIEALGQEQVIFTPDISSVPVSFNAPAEDVTTTAVNDLVSLGDDGVYYVQDGAVITVIYSAQWEVAQAAVQYVFCTDEEHDYDLFTRPQGKVDEDRTTAAYTVNGEAWKADPAAIESYKDVSRVLTLSDGRTDTVRFTPDYETVTFDSDLQKADVDEADQEMTDNGLLVTVTYHPQVRFATATIKYVYGEDSYSEIEGYAYDLRGTAVTVADAEAGDGTDAYTVPVSAYSLDEAASWHLLTDMPVGSPVGDTHKITKQFGSGDGESDAYTVTTTHVATEAEAKAALDAMGYDPIAGSDGKPAGWPDHSLVPNTENYVLWMSINAWYAKVTDNTYGVWMYAFYGYDGSFPAILVSETETVTAEDQQGDAVYDFLPDYDTVTVTTSGGGDFIFEPNAVYTVTYHPATEYVTATIEYRFDSNETADKSRLANGLYPAVGEEYLFDLSNEAVTYSEARANPLSGNAYTVTVAGKRTRETYNGDWGEWITQGTNPTESPETVSRYLQVGWQQSQIFGATGRNREMGNVEFTPDLESVTVSFNAAPAGAETTVNTTEKVTCSGDTYYAENGGLITVWYGTEFKNEYILETGHQFHSHVANQVGGDVSKIVFGKFEDYADGYGFQWGNGTAVDSEHKYNIQLFKNGTEAYVLTKGTMIANPDCDWMFGYDNTVDMFNGLSGGAFMNLREVRFDKDDEGNGIFDTRLMKTAEHMYQNCESLATVDMSGWIGTLENLNSTHNMFEECNSLVTITFGEDWKSAHPSKMSDMFAKCAKLKNIDWENIATLVTSRVTGNELSGLFWHDESLSLTGVDLSGWDLSNCTDLSNMFYNCYSLGDADLSGWDVQKVTNMSGMFNMADGEASGYRGPTSINLNGWNTASMTNTSSMFRGTEKLSSITFGENWNTGKVTTMNGMFFDCGMTEMDLSSWDVSSVKTMANMFRASTKLQKLDLHGWNTASLTNVGTYTGSSMDAMFMNCSSLNTLDLSGWTNPQLTNIAGLFGGLTGLRNLNVTGFNTSSVTNMERLFDMCGITAVDLSTWDTSNVTTMFAMFRNTRRLESANLSGGFSTENVTNMREMFCITTDGVRTTEVLDLRNFDTKNVTNMYMMFSGQNKLKTIYATDAFVVSGADTGSMFDQCAVLAGSYNMTSPVGNFGNRKNSTDGTYAKVDRDGQEGYFTEPRPEGDVPVTGVRIVYSGDVNMTKGKIRIGVGATFQLTAVVEPENATNQDVVWSTSDSDLITVNANGLVTCRKTGAEPTVTVTTRDGRYTASVGFYPYTSNLYRPDAVKIYSGTEDLTGGDLDLTMGEEEELTGRLSPAGSSYSGTWTWTSSNESVATVNDGHIQAIAPGTAVIAVSISYEQSSRTVTRSAECTVHVYGMDEVTGVTLSEHMLDLAVGTGSSTTTAKLSANLTPATARKTGFTWTSNDESVATVDEYGNVVAVAVGSAEITVTTEDGYADSCQVTVSEYVAVESVEIWVGNTNMTGQRQYIAVGGTVQLTAKVYPENASNQSIVWKSSSSEVTVDQDGLIRGVKTGWTPTITVTTVDGGKQATITAYPKSASEISVTGVSLDKTSVNLVVDETETLTATILPVGAASSISWTSGDEDVAMVENGVITAIGPGTTTITAKTGNGKTTTCEVTVTGVAKLVGVKLSETSLSLEPGKTQTLTATAIPRSAETGGLTWTSSDTSVATVDSTGKITAVADGSATITATTQSGGLTATCEVTVKTKEYAANTVAVIGDAEYSSLDRAVSAVKDATATVKLVKDATIGTSNNTITGNVTLDLNGHTVSSTVSGRLFRVWRGGSLAVIDSEGGGKLENTSDYTFYVPSGHEATLTIGGNVTVVNNAGYAIWVEGNATLNVNGGSISHDNSRNTKETISLSGSGSLALNMTSGSISNDTGLNVINGRNKNVALNISGGTLTGKINATVVEGSSVTGGTFTIDPTSFVSDGYKAVDNGNGTWTVQAIAVEHTYSLEYDANGGEGGITAAGSPWTVTSETYEVTVTGDEFTRDGYTFLGWSNDPDATEATYTGGEKIELTADEPYLTLYAVWQEIPQEDPAQNGEETPKDSGENQEPVANTNALAPASTESTEELEESEQSEQSDPEEPEQSGDENGTSDSSGEESPEPQTPPAENE